MQNHILQLLQQHGFVVEESGVTISVGAALVLLSWSTWPFVLTACHVFRCHRGVDSAPLVILFANSPSSPALYFVLIISPLSCPRVCCLMSVRMRYSECSVVSLPVVYLTLYRLFIFSSPAVWRTCYCILSFFTHDCSSRTLVGSLLGFSLPVCPPRCSSPSRFLSARARRSLWIQLRLAIAVSPPLCPIGSAEVGLVFALYKRTICWGFMAVRLIFGDWVFSVLFSINFWVIHLLWIPVSFLTYGLTNMDPAGEEFVRSAIAHQGALLGHQASQLSSTAQEVETLTAQVAELSGRFRELQQNVCCPPLQQPPCLSLTASPSHTPTTRPYMMEIRIHVGRFYLNVHWCSRCNHADMLQNG